MTNNHSIKSVCVYCGSSSQVADAFFAEARALGKLLAIKGIECICGGGNQGLMAALADAVLENGGTVIGIIPHFMVEEGWQYQGLTEVIETETMHARKTEMAERCDAAIALPGGCGTIEELLEIITWKQLGIFLKPISIINLNGYYDPLLAQLQNAVDEHFMRGVHREIWSATPSASTAIEAILNTQPWDIEVRKFAAI